MNYFDPNRPKVGDRPALLWNGKVVGALPGLVFTLLPTKFCFLLEACVVIAPSTGRWLQYEVADPINYAPQQILEAYREDPEAVLKAFLNWTYHEEARRESRSLSLTDLGDLE